MKKRCRSWRCRGIRLNQGKPGKDRSRWRTCGRPRLPGFFRCRQCFEELAVHPDVRVRRMLASEADLPLDIRQTLSFDSDVEVARLARKSTDLTEVIFDNPLDQMSLKAGKN